jgi:hypothetical protein
MNKKEEQHLIDSGLYELKIPDIQQITPTNSFVFHSKQDELPIIVIDEKGFQYKGELIEDAGEVYKLFKEFLQTINYKQD